MKKYLLLMLLSLTQMLVCSAQVLVDGIYYSFNASDLTAQVARYRNYDTRYSGDFVIPESVVYRNNTYRVTSIGDFAFSGCDGLTSVTIPESVTTIGEGAFNECSGLTSFDIPSGVTSIQRFTFFECSGLNTIDIPDNVVSIGSAAFYGCTGLTSIYIPSTIISFEGNAFERCSNIVSIIVDSQNPAYDSRENCNAIIETTSNTLITGCQESFVPDGIVSIGSSAFSDCKGLTSLVIPNSVTSFGVGAFYGCEDLSSINIPDGTTNLESDVFRFCKALPSIDIPKSVIFIGGRAFEGCDALERINIADVSAWCGIQFGGSMFGDDEWEDNPVALPLYLNGEPLRELVIPEDVVEIGAMAFNNCRTLTSVTIPNSVTSIGDYAFHGCTGLTSLSIPASVAVIGALAFSNCENIESIVVDADNSVYDSRDTCNAIIKTLDNLLIFGCKNSTIPDGVTIGSWAFSNSGLESIDIPESMNEIPYHAFYGCKSLKSVTIPSTVTAIRGGAFVGCNALEHINISDITAWCNMKLGERGGSDFIWEYAFDVTPLYLNGEPVEELVIPEGVEQIPDLAFYNCHSLKSVILPNSVGVIDMEAFEGCDNLTFMKAGSGLHFINFNALSMNVFIIENPWPPFIEMRPYASVFVPYGSKENYDGYYEQGRASWGKGAREFYTSPEGIYYGLYPDDMTVKVVLTNYYDDTDPMEVKVPETIECEGVSYTVNGIGHKAFEINRSVTSITLPSTIISVDDFAFHKCTGLTEMYCYAEEVPTASETAFEASNAAEAILYVPAASVESYKASSPWNTFKEIRPITTTAIELLDIIGENNDAQNEIFRLDGQFVNDVSLLPSGSIVVVKKGDKVEKVMIK